MPCTPPNVYVEHTQLSFTGTQGADVNIGNRFFYVAMIGGAATSGNNITGYDLEISVNDGEYKTAYVTSTVVDGIMFGVPEEGNHYTTSNWSSAYGECILFFSQTGRVRFRARTKDSSGSSNYSAWAYSPYVTCFYDGAENINFTCTQTRTERGIHVTWPAEPSSSYWGTNTVVNYRINYRIVTDNSKSNYTYTDKILAAIVPAGTTSYDFTIDDVLSPNLRYLFEVDIETPYGIIEGRQPTTTVDRSVRVFDGWEVDG